MENILRKIGEAMVSAAQAGADYVYGEIVEIDPERGRVVVEVRGEGVRTVEFTPNLEAALEVVEVEEHGHYPPSGYQLFHDPMVPAPWDGTRPQPVGVRAILREK